MRSPYDRVRAATLALQELRSTHIDQLHETHVIDHDVLGLNVSVDDEVGVEVFDTQ